jgi:hypothetical protein
VVVNGLSGCVIRYLNNFLAPVGRYDSLHDLIEPAVPVVDLLGRRGAGPRCPALLFTPSLFAMDGAMAWLILVIPGRNRVALSIRSPDSWTFR